MELTMKEFNPQVPAVEALGGLSHDTRLSVFRMLVKAGPEGLIAGAIAQAANVPPSTMSHHLGILERAGLVESERESRLIHYRADYRSEEHTSELQSLMRISYAVFCLKKKNNNRMKTT